MNLSKRQIFEIEPDFLRIGGQQIRPQRFGFLLTVRALEIAEDYDDDRRTGSAEAGLQIGVQLVELRLERILGYFEDIAAQDFLAVLGNVERLVGGGIAGRRVHGDFFESWQRTRLRIINLDLDLRAPHVQMAYVSFQRGLIESGLPGRRFFGGP